VIQRGYKKLASQALKEQSLISAHFSSNANTINSKRNQERKLLYPSCNEISTIQGVYEVFPNPTI
jgi:hypothetical protein